jgi:hypothetical protein
MSVTAELDTSVLEGSTIVVTASFTDEDGNSVVPNELKYTLKKEGTIVNSKDETSISPSSSVDVVLSGDDLPQGTLYFIIEGTYDSNAGSDLPLKGWAKIEVSDSKE